MADKMIPTLPRKTAKMLWSKFEMSAKIKAKIRDATPKICIRDPYLTIPWGLGTC